MANTILIKRGLEKDIGSITLQEGEIAIAYNDDKSSCKIYTAGSDGIPMCIMGEVDVSQVTQEAKNYTDTKINELINGAPEAMDTLKELSDAIAANSDVMTALQSAIGNKVDKIEGKGLSANDYTDDEKTKLSGISVGANNYVHPENHAPSIIIQDSSNRFVTDAEKSTWNSKLDTSSIIDGGTF